MIKLIASDIDGTLVPDGTDQIDPRLFDVLQELLRHDVIFVAASGRQYISLRKLFSPVKDNIYYITDNGGFLRYKNYVYSSNIIDKDLLFELIEDVRKLPGCDIMLCGQDMAYCEDEGDMFRLMRDAYKFNIQALGDFELHLRDDIAKLSIYHPEDCEPVVMEWFYDKWKDKCKIASAGIKWMDITNLNSDKGVALTTLMEKLNIKKNEAMAFGDNINDLGMLAAVEESYAIGSAREEVKEFAKHVADTRENQGVLKELSRFLGTIDGRGW